MLLVASLDVLDQRDRRELTRESEQARSRKKKGEVSGRPTSEGVPICFGSCQGTIEIASEKFKDSRQNYFFNSDFDSESVSICAEMTEQQARESRLATDVESTCGCNLATVACLSKLSSMLCMPCRHKIFLTGGWRNKLRCKTMAQI